jgi:hypothetical protein
MTGAQESPAKQLAGFLAKYDAAIGKLVRAARSRLRKRLPGAVELVYDNYNALAIAFSPTERPSDAVVGLAVYPRWVSLYFMHGAKLDDPSASLRGSGNQGRYVVLEGAQSLDEAPIKALLDAAIRASKAPFREARGYTIIKSVSARQRPRRAAFTRGSPASRSKKRATRV